MNLHTRVKNALKIAVFGSDEDYCTDAARGIAYFVGREIALRNHILYTNGQGGVMEAACRGARDAEGISIGIIPSSYSRQVHPYCSLVIPIDISFSFAALQILINSVDAAVLIGGSLETRTEAQLVTHLEKTLVVLSCSGGIAADIAEEILDPARMKPLILSAADHCTALDMIVAYYAKR